MYIEFKLPQVGGTLTALWVKSHLTKDVEIFCGHHSYSYRSELDKYSNTLQIRFDQLEAYTMFILEWQGKPYKLCTREDRELPDIHPDFI